MKAQIRYCLALSPWMLFNLYVLIFSLENNFTCGQSHRIDLTIK